MRSGLPRKSTNPPGQKARKSQFPISHPPGLKARDPSAWGKASLASPQELSPKESPSTESAPQLDRRRDSQKPEQKSGIKRVPLHCILHKKGERCNPLTLVPRAPTKRLQKWRVCFRPFMMEPSDRQWYWWDAQVLNDGGQILVAVVVEGWPFPWGSLRWLFQAAGASMLEPEG